MGNDRYAKRIGQLERRGRGKKGDKETTMIVYKMVTKEQDGRLVSLMEKGKRQMEYRPGEVTYPPVGILYARDSLEAALQAIKEYKAGQIPTAELWEAEATGVTDIGYSTIVGCASLKLLRKLYPIES
jgi:hypothetical protein